MNHIEYPIYTVENGYIIVVSRNKKVLSYFQGISYIITKQKIPIVSGKTRKKPIKSVKKAITGSITISNDNYRCLKNGKKEIDIFDVEILSVKNVEISKLDITGIKIVKNELIENENKLIYTAKNVGRWKTYKK